MLAVTSGRTNAPYPPLALTKTAYSLDNATTDMLRSMSVVGRIIEGIGEIASSAPAQPPSTAASLATAALLSGAMLAAVLMASVAVWTARRRSREEERSRQRDLFAGAFQAYAAYKEMPYAIRRRNHQEPAAERVRLSETTREIQGRLSYFVAWTSAESATVGAAYAALVNELRKVAGGAMREAWRAKPISEDTSMNIPPVIIDLSSLAPLETAFTAAVRDHLHVIAPWWVR